MRTAFTLCQKLFPRTWANISEELTGAGKADPLEASIPSEFPVPAFGEHDLEPPANTALFHPPGIER